MSKDAIGLTLVDGNPFAGSPPTIVTYGSSGSGKSTDVARACQDAVFLMTNANVLAPYGAFLAHLKRTKPEELKLYKPYDKLAKVLFTPAILAEKKIGAREALKKIFNTIEAGVKTGKVKYRGVVIDEATVLSTMAYEEIQADKNFCRNGKPNGFAINDANVAFHRWLIQFPQRTGLYLVLVCHERPPLYISMDDETAATALKGGLKAKGGPAFATSALTATLSHESDYCLQLCAEGDITGGNAERYYKTELDELWHRKVRGSWGLPAKIPISEKNLRALLEDSGLSL